jgi:hypothetical protein
MELGALVTTAKDAEDAIELARIERRAVFYAETPEDSHAFLQEALRWRVEVRQAFLRKFFEVEGT